MTTPESPQGGPIRFAHVCLMVKDIEVAIQDYRDILGVVAPEQIIEPVVFYDDFGMGEERLAFATFVSPNDGVEIQLMQPKKPGTPLYERLQKRGEHVHHLCFTSERVRDTVDILRHAGIDIVPNGFSQDPQMAWQEWTFIHPSKSHGVLIELANHYRSVDGKWAPATSSDATTADTTQP